MIPCLFLSVDHGSRKTGNWSFPGDLVGFLARMSGDNIHFADRVSLDLLKAMSLGVVGIAITVDLQ